MRFVKIYGILYLLVIVFVVTATAYGYFTYPHVDSKGTPSLTPLQLLLYAAVVTIETQLGFLVDILSSGIIFALILLGALGAGLVNKGGTRVRSINAIIAILSVVVLAFTYGSFTISLGNSTTFGYYDIVNHVQTYPSPLELGYALIALTTAVLLPVFIGYLLAAKLLQHFLHKAYRVKSSKQPRRTT